MIMDFENQPTLSTELITQSVQKAMNDFKLSLTFQLLEGVECPIVEVRNEN